MEFLFNETDRKRIHEWQEFISNEIKPFRDQNNLQATFPRETMKKLSDRGLLQLTIPQKFGGNRVDAKLYALAMMMVAEADAGVSTAMSVTNMVTEMIHHFGSEDLKRKYLPRFAEGKYLAGSFALTESNAGSNPVAMKTRAIEQSDGSFILNGEKVFITSGDEAGVVIVFAITDPELKHKGITAFLIEKGTPGLSVGKREAKMGQHSSSTVSLILKNVKVDAKSILGNRGDGFKIAMKALDSGRIGISSQAFGIASAAYKYSVHTFKMKENEPVLQQQHIQLRLAEYRSRLEACKLMILNAAHAKSMGESFSFSASMAKYYVTETANWLISDAYNLLGMLGPEYVFPLGQLLEDVRVTTIYEGTSEIQRIVIYRHLIEESFDQLI